VPATYGAMTSVAISIPVAVLVGETIARKEQTTRRAVAGQQAALTALAKANVTDDLTGLGNRRWANSLLDALQDGDALAILDLDHFKDVNDTCSHQVGDRVLRTVAELLQDAESGAGSGDGAGSFAARMGGEEFLLVLVGVDLSAAVHRLEAIREAVRAHPWAELTGGLPVTVSIGAASSAGLPDPSPAELLGRADAHLYRAKRQGRDRVVGDPT
jgi:two-component system, cell cycle response regulator